MKSRVSKILCLFLSASMFLPPGIARAEKRQVDGGTYVVVIPASDGNADDRSEGLARAVSDALRITTGDRVADADLSAKVMRYHGPSDEGEPGEERALGQLARAKEEFFAFRYEKAADALSLAISGLEAMPERLSYTGAGLVDAYLTRAVIAKSKGDDPLVRGSVARALAVDPNLRLEAGQYPPGLVAIFEAARSSMAAGDQGELTVETRPAAAEVKINGVARGVSPLSVKLPAGEYRVLIKASRYEDVERAVKVEPARSTSLKEKLVWKKGEAKPAGSVRDLGEEAEVREGLRVAEVMKADKVVLVNADESEGEERLSLRMVDGRLKLGQAPIVVGSRGPIPPALLAEAVAKLSVQSGADLLANLTGDSVVKGAADPSVLTKRKRPLKKNPAFWAIVGTALAGALAGGLVAAFSGGSGERGDVKVRFR